MPGEIITHVDSVNSEAFVQRIREAEPDIIVVNGTRIIAKHILEQLTCPIINVHVGITPLYRGVHGAYWALTQNDRAHCGVTVHMVDAGIDTGGILQQATIEPGHDDNFVTYPYLQFAKAVELVKKAVPEVLAGSYSIKPVPEGKSKLWYHPTIWQYLKYRLKGVK